MDITAGENVMAMKTQRRDFTLGKAALLVGLMAVAIVLRGAPTAGDHRAETAGQMLDRIVPAVVMDAIKDCDKDKVGVEL